jgi:chemotaxis protein methyltransferase CheR
VKPEDVAFVADVVRKRSGLILSSDKAYLVESRLAPLARQRELPSVEALIQTLRKTTDEKLLWAVTDALTTNETFFFRDKTPFDQFRDEVLPALAAKRGAGPLRVWCAACSTGQEPYSIAMLMEDLKAKYPTLKLDICASDISDRVLEKAKAGIYTQFEVQRGLPITQLVKFFDKADENWQVKAHLRQVIRWRQFNLLEDMRPLGRFDVVYCRNVLIYFDPETKRKVLENIAAVMADDGYLFLGAAETVMGLTDAFQPAPGHRGLYARNPSFKKAAA